MSRSVANFLDALAAVVGGNIVYFLLEKHLPSAAHHALFKIDLGMVVDFCICLVFFLIIKALAPRSE
jgi:cytosine/uracil/thiamine/allantoin permease